MLEIRYGPRVFPLGWWKKSCQAGRICKPNSRTQQLRTIHITTDDYIPFTRDESRPLMEAVRRGTTNRRFSQRMPISYFSVLVIGQKPKDVLAFFHHGPLWMKSTTVHSGSGDILLRSI